MSGLDSIPLDSSGFLDMEGFPDDGTVLGDDTLAGLRQALLSDPVDEPTDQDWAALVDDALVDVEVGEAAPADGPFAVDDDGSLAGVRHADDDEGPTDADGTDVTDEDTSDGPEADDDAADPDADGTEATLPDDDGTGLDLDLDGDLGAHDLIGLDLLDPDDDALGAEALAHAEEADAPTDVGPTFEDYL